MDLEFVGKPLSSGQQQPRHAEGKQGETVICGVLVTAQVAPSK